MKSSTNLTLGVILVALIVGTLAVTAYAAPVATQNGDQIRDPTNCPNFVDQDGDGICDNCPRETGTGLEGHHQYRHGGWS